MGRSSEFEIETDEEKIIDKYSLDTTGMSSLWSSKSDNGTVYVDATFDYSYGYSPESVLRYFSVLHDDKEKGTIDVLASIKFYEQSVASISTAKSSYFVYWAGRDGDERLQIFDDADEMLDSLLSLKINR